MFAKDVSGPKKQPKHKVLGRDIPGTSGTQTSGYPGQKLYVSGLFSVVLDREWPGCPGIWVGTSRIWKNFMQQNFGLIFRTLMFDLDKTCVNDVKCGLILSFCTSELPKGETTCCNQVEFFSGLVTFEQGCGSQLRSIQHTFDRFLQTCYAYRVG